MVPIDSIIGSIGS